MQLIFATNNANKVKEIRKIVNADLSIITLKEAGIDIDIPEPHNTLKENASEKSQTIYKLTAQNCFSEDTGLLVDALNGAPGVRSARYAGEPANDENNIKKLLQQLESATARSARFITVISLIWQQKEYWFEGVCEGHIIAEKIGDGGFGYDPIFVPEGSSKTFAQMTTDQKNIFSHRKKATKKLIDFLDLQLQ